MSGFDNGTLQSGLSSQVKELGSILRGFGPPVPAAGVAGDLYIDTLTWFLYAKREAPDGETDPWGHYIFTVPATYQPQLKWFGTYPPTNDVGVNGDYYMLWGGYPNYGVGEPSIFGPKAAGVWPGAPASVNVLLNPLYTAQDTHGV